MPNSNNIHWTLPPQPDRLTVNRFVNLLGDPKDYHCVLLASMGFTYDVISEQTSLTHGQIAYRLARANRNRSGDQRISATNYRTGRSESAKAVIKLSAKKVGQIITPQIRHTLAVDI